MKMQSLQSIYYQENSKQQPSTELSNMLQDHPRELPRTFKALPHHILFVYQDHSTLVLKLHPKERQSFVLQTSVAHSQLPLPLQVNFASVDEVLADIAVIDSSRISLDGLNRLNIQLQVGSRLRDCSFQLTQKQVSYQQQIEYLLWHLQGQHRHLHEDKANISQVNGLKLAVERQAREVADLAQQLYKERQKSRALEEKYQEVVDRQRQIVEENKREKIQRDNKEVEFIRENFKKQFEKEVESIRENFKKQLEEEVRRLTHEQGREEEEREEDRTGQEPIVVPPEESPQPEKTGKTNHLQAFSYPHPKKTGEKVSSISSDEFDFYQKFQMDSKLINESDANSFYRVGQRFKLVKGDQKSKMVTSLSNIGEPKGKVIFRLINSKKNLIWVGLQLQERLHLLSTKRDPNCISYKLTGGKQLFENGVQSGLSLPLIHNLQSLSIEVNRSSGRIRWSKVDCQGMESEICQRPIPLSFKGKELYPFVTMIDKDDQIEFA